MRACRHSSATHPSPASAWLARLDTAAGLSAASCGSMADVSRSIMPVRVLSGSWIAQHHRKPLVILAVLKVGLLVQRHPGMPAYLPVGHAALEARAEVDHQRHTRPAPEMIAR